jgi:hypothetical protein
LVFKKNANFFAENWEKSQKIVIITSTPGHVAVVLRNWVVGRSGLGKQQKWSKNKPGLKIESYVGTYMYICNYT